MTAESRTRRGAGTALIVLGALILASVALAFGWNQYQGQRLKARLAQLPTPQPAALAAPATPTHSPTPTEAPSPLVAPAATQPQPSVTIASAKSAIPSASAVPLASPQPTNVPAAVDDGPPVRIVIPDLGIDAPVVEMMWRIVETDQGPVSEWVIPQNEAGHHINSAHLGQTGNIVISGHNNIYGKVFEPISQAWDNDSRKPVDAATDRSDTLNGRLVQLYDAAGRRFDYRIEEFYRLKDTGVSLAQRQANSRYMLPTDDARLTIITCWPPWNNTHRLILIARPAAAS